MQMYSSRSDDPSNQVVEHHGIKPTTTACAAFKYLGYLQRNVSQCTNGVQYRPSFLHHDAVIYVICYAPSDSNR